MPGRQDEALRLISKAIAMVPSQFSSELWAAKALILFMGQKFDESIVCSTRAIQINPRHYHPHWVKALALSGLKQFYPALPFYDEAILLNPADADIDYGRGLALYFLDRQEEAFAWLKDPKVEEHPLRASYFLGLRAFHAQPPNYQEALARFQEAKIGSKFNGDRSDLFSWQGECHLAMGNLSKALECFEEAIKQNSKDALSYHGKGVVLSKQGQSKEAQECFDKALTLDQFYYKSDYLRVKKLPSQS